MKKSILWLLLVAVWIPFALQGQSICKHCANVRMYFQSYEEGQIDGQLNVRLYCIAEETGQFSLPQFSSDWSQTLQANQIYPEKIEMQVGDSLVFDYVMQYDTVTLPYYSVSLQVNTIFETPDDAYPVTHTLYLYFTPYNSVEVFDQTDYFAQRRVWLVGNEVAAPSRIFIPKDSIPISDIPSGFEPDVSDIVYDYINIEGLAYAIPMLYKDFEGYNPTNGVGGEERANTFHGEINNLRIFATDIDDKGNPTPKEISLKGARVEIWRDRTIGDQHIGTFFTDDEGFVLDNGNRVIHFTWTANASNIQIYLKIRMKNSDESIRVKRKWDIHDANLVKTQNQNLAHSSNFIGLNFTNHANGLQLDENELGNVLTWIVWAKQITNHELAGTGGSIHDDVKVTVKFDNNTVTNCQYDGIALRLDNECFKAEGIVIHELGHFVDDQIQNCLSWLSGAGLHQVRKNNKNTPQTMSEGFASGYAQIIDEMTFQVDMEAGGREDKVHELWPYSKIPNAIITDGNPHLHHPFLSENILARTMLDLWDGPNNMAVFNNTRPQNEYYDGGFDNFEMSFKDILLPFIQHGCALNDMNAYYQHLLTGDCEHDRQIKDIFHLNFSLTDKPLSEVMVLNTDDIARNRTFSQIRFPQVDQDPLVDSVFYDQSYSFLDVSTLSGNVDDFNVTRYDLSIVDASTGFLLSGTINHDFSPIVLSDDISVINGATLNIHGTITPNFANIPPPPSQLWNYTQFHSPLEVQFCGNRTCTISNGGTVEVGTVSPTQHEATYTIKEGSKLRIENGGILKVLDNSKVIIEQGATLIIESGSQIELLGSNAILEIQGNLELKDNTIFTFTGSGFVRFVLPSTGGNNIMVGNNCELKFVGSHPNDKVLEIGDNSYLSSYDLFNTTVQNGRVELGEYAFWDTGGGAVLFENATFTSINPLNPYQTIYTNGQGPIIHDCKFSYGQTGLTARNFGSLGAGITLANVEIHNCTIGLQSYDKGGDMFSVNFHHNETGWKQDYASFNSTWHDSKAYHNAYVGVWYEGNTDLYMKTPRISYNSYGSFFQGSGTLQATCGEINVNTNWGITLTDNATLDLAGNLSGSPKVDVGHNDLSIFVWNADYLYLKNGYNNLSPVTQTGSFAVGGFLNTSNSPLVVTHNHWNEISPYGLIPNPGSIPVQGQDYSLIHSSTGNPITLTDSNPIYFESCTPISYERVPYIAECSECAIIYTNTFDGIRLDNALKEVATEVYIENNAANTLSLCSKLYEIINYDYDTLSTQDQELLDAAWRMVKVVFAEGIKKGQISAYDDTDLSTIGTQVLTALENRITQNPTKKFSLLTDKIWFYNLANRPEMALSVLLQMETTDEREVEMKSYWACYLEIRRDIEDNVLQLYDVQSRLLQCPSLSLPTWSNSENKMTESTNKGNSFSLYPNPTQDKVYLLLNLERDTQIKMDIYDTSGKMVLSFPVTDFKKGTTSTLLPLNGFAMGLYNVVIRTDNEIFTYKMVVE